MANNNGTKFFYGETMVANEAGEANYVYINNRVNEYNGNKSFSVNMKFSEKYTKELCGTLEKLLDEHMKSQDGKQLKWSRNPVPGYIEDNEGNITSKMSAKRKDAKGELAKVPLYDSQGNELDPMTNFGSGSIVVPMFQPAVYHMNANNNGVTLYLEGIQLIEPKIYTGGGSKPKFKPVSGGYVAGDTKYNVEEDDDVPI